MHSPLKRNDRLCAGAIVLGVALLLGYGLHCLSQRYRLAYDPQTEKQRCLPWHIYIVDTKIKTVTSFKKGHLIAIKVPENPFYPIGTPFIKQVVGVSGSKIQIKNHNIMVDALVCHTIINRPDIKPYLALDNSRLKPGQLFVVGYRNNSLDSTYFGPITHQNIIGKAYAVF